jgi:lipid A ethanolaminephosphotransferase
MDKTAPLPPPRRPFTIPATVEQVVLAASLFWLLAGNRVFLGAALKGRSGGDVSVWALGGALALAVFALHVLLLGLAANRHTVKPLVGVLTVVVAAAAYFMGNFGVVFDPSMLRNTLRTDTAEAAELVSTAFVLHMGLYAALPLALLARVRVRHRPWRRALAVRGALLVASLVLLVGALLSVFQPLASLMRNQRELRYLVTPANVLWSAGAVAAADLRGAARPREPIGTDARAGPSWATRRKPLVLVLVVGETARAANWGLSGYARQTTPELAALPVLNFGAVSSCGTNTEVSVPCLFAPVGRRDYDEAHIRGQQSLLHVLARAGAAVHWRDNQSGCKGVCEGLPGDTVAGLNPTGLCQGERCLDEGLLADIDQRLQRAEGTQVWVLHMLGSHGPSYFRRHPAAYARFQPECQHDDLRECSVPEIVNAYDNSLLYTDHVLATAIAKLQAASGRVDSALVYVSDHGESLGEMGLFLHGMPWSIAPAVQQQVPMVFWASPGFEQASGLAPGCLEPQLRRSAVGAVSHDHVFHTVLGLLDVHTALHEPALDLVDACRIHHSASR